MEFKFDKTDKDYLRKLSVEYTTPEDPLLKKLILGVEGNSDTVQKVQSFMNMLMYGSDVSPTKDFTPTKETLGSQRSYIVREVFDMPPVVVDVNSSTLDCDAYYEANKDLYETKPLFIEDFINSLEGVNVYPYWIDKLKEIYPNPYAKTTGDIMLSGAIGIGKKFIPVIGLLYEIYLLGNLKNPHSYLKLTRDEELVFLITNFTNGAMLSPLVSFEYLTRLISNSPVFKPQFTRTSKGGVTTISLMKNIVITNDKSLMFNSNLVSCFLDYQRVSHEGIKMKYERLAKFGESYNGIKVRMLSRFHGTPFCGSVYITCGIEDVQYVRHMIVNCNMYPNTNSLFLNNIRVWQVKKDIENFYSGKSFYVFKGDDKDNTPRILSDDEYITLGGYYNTKNTLTIPIEYLENFKKDIYLSLRDIAGIEVIPKPSMSSEVTATDGQVGSNIQPELRIKSYNLDPLTNILTLRLPDKVLEFKVEKNDDGFIVII